MTGRKIGIMGGTFDPLHNGHLQAAKAALQECALDHVDFIPAASPPHKTGGAEASFADRVNMIREVCAECEKISCNDIEGYLQTPSYSIDTLNSLLNGSYKNSQLYFVIGIDAFLEIDLWKSFEEVLKRVHFIVCQRLGCNNEKIHEFLNNLGYQNDKGYWQSREYSRNIYLLETIPEQISSTELKTILRQGGNIHKLVPAPVSQYIQKNGLYTITSITC